MARAIKIIGRLFALISTFKHVYIDNKNLKESIAASMGSILYSSDM